jgi:hypothetical protein
MNLKNTAISAILLLSTSVSMSSNANTHDVSSQFNNNSVIQSTVKKSVELNQQQELIAAAEELSTAFAYKDSSLETKMRRMDLAKNIVNESIKSMEVISKHSYRANNLHKYQNISDQDLSKGILSTIAKYKRGNSLNVDDYDFNKNLKDTGSQTDLEIEKMFKDNKLGFKIIKGLILKDPYKFNSKKGFDSNLTASNNMKYDGLDEILKNKSMEKTPDKKESITKKISYNK